MDEGRHDQRTRPHVPEWPVERLVAGDLGNERAGEVRARLAELGELDRISQLELANDATHGRHPASSVVAEVEKRLLERGLGARQKTALRTHIARSRGLVRRSLVAFSGGFLLAWAFRERALVSLTRPYVAALESADHGPPLPALHFQSPASLFETYLRVAVLGGFLLALPVGLYQLWKLMTFGVHAHARKFAKAFALGSWGACVGAGWCVWRFLAPNAFQLLLSAKTVTREVAIEPDVLIGDYVSFFTSVIVGCAFTVEISVVALSLSLARVAGYEELLRFGRRFLLLALALALALAVTAPYPISVLLLFPGFCLVYSMTLRAVLVVENLRLLRR